MVATGNHIRIKDFQTMDNIEGDILNVYFFEVLALTIGTPLSDMATELGNWWANTFLTDILAIQCTTVHHTRIEVDCMENFVADSAIIPFSPFVSGNVGGDYMSSAVSVSFQLIRDNRTTRHGRKAIAGASDTFGVNNVATPAALLLFTEVAENLQDAWSIDVGPGGTMLLSPVIAKTPVPPATLPTIYNGVVGAQYRGFGTQNTRKQLLS